MVKRYLLRTASRAGLFAASRLLTSQGVRILCYHGISMDDEHRFSPGTFMCPNTFAGRMETLHRWGLPVIALDDALSALSVGRIPDNAVVITIDDGWHGTYAHMLPVLREFGFRATIYASTYYVEKQTFVFNVFVDYLLTLHGRGTLDVHNVDERLCGMYLLDDRPQRLRALQGIVDLGESLDAVGREVLCLSLARCLDYDIDRAREKKMFKFMSRGELRDASEWGFDVQLHTHRHRFAGVCRAEADAELEDNAAALRGIGFSTPRQHFCYPSGQHEPHHAAWLSERGVLSAVTTEFGINFPTTPRYALKRICDSEAMSDLEFESALTGFTSFIRNPMEVLFSKRRPATP
jgi:Polysaccharide deacetylase